MSTDGEYHNGNARIDCAVAIDAFVEYDKVVVETTAERTSARDQTIRCALSPEEAKAFLENLQRSIELSERR